MGFGEQVDQFGLHHVAIISGCAADTYDFYAGLLGLRLVKQTVSSAEPGARLLYFGDGAGRPGTLIGSIVWEGAAPGTIGAGDVSEIAFGIPPGSGAWWSERLHLKAVDHGWGETADTGPFISLRDPDGLPIRLVETSGSTVETVWAPANVDPRFALRGLREVALSVRPDDRTTVILQKVFGFTRIEERPGYARLVAHDGPGGAILLRTVEGSERGRLGAGTIRKIAFRAQKIDDLFRMTETLKCVYGIATSDLEDRTYLSTVKFRAPCGALFAIATDGPGFEVDEGLSELGTTLKLPLTLEARRTEILATLPRLHRP